jgi:carbamoylphosphate synthase large subunit
MADHIYLKLWLLKSIIEILKHTRIDAVLPTMGVTNRIKLVSWSGRKEFGLILM